MKRRGLLSTMIGLGLLIGSRGVGAQELTPLKDMAQGVLTAQTMDEAVLLGRPRQGTMQDSEWCGESRVAGVNSEGIWLYDTGDSGHIDFMPAPKSREGEIYYSFRLQTASPDCHWLIGLETAQVPHEGQPSTGVGRFKVWNTDTKQEIVIPKQLADFYQYEAYQERTFEYHFAWAGQTLFVYRTALSLMNRPYNERDSQLQIWKTDGSQWDLETLITYPATEYTPYTFEYVLPSADGKQVITVVRSFISEQHIITRWTRSPDTMTPTLLYEEPSLPQTSLTITGLQWAADETSVAIVATDRVLRYAIPSGEALPAYTDVCGDLTFLGVLYAQNVVMCTTHITSYGTGPLTLVRLTPGTNETKERIALDEAWRWQPSATITPSSWVLFTFFKQTSGIVFLNVETMREHSFLSTYLYNGVTFDVRMKGNDTWALLGFDLSWSGSHEIHAWNLESQETSVPVFGPRAIYDVAIAPDSASILGATSDGIYQWTAFDQAPHQLELEVESPNALAFSPDGKTLYVSSHKDISVFDWPALTPRQGFKLPLEIYRLLPTPNGKALVVTTAEAQLFLLSPDGKVLTQRTVRGNSPILPVYESAITPDNKYLVLDLNVFEITDHALLPVETAHPDLPPLVQQIFAIKEAYKSFPSYNKDKINGFIQSLPRFVETAQGTELVALDSLTEQLASEAVPQAMPLQVTASDHLLVVKTQDAYRIYGIPEGHNP